MNCQDAALESPWNWRGMENIQWMVVATSWQMVWGSWYEEHILVLMKQELIHKGKQTSLPRHPSFCSKIRKQDTLRDSAGPHKIGQGITLPWICWVDFPCMKSKTILSLSLTQSTEIQSFLTLKVKACQVSQIPEWTPLSVVFILVWINHHRAEKPPTILF